MANNKLYEKLINSISKSLQKSFNINESYRDQYEKYLHDLRYWEDSKRRYNWKDTWLNMTYDEYKNDNLNADYNEFLEVKNRMKKSIDFYINHPKPPVQPAWPKKWDGIFMADYYTYYNKCNKMDACEVQEITRWEDECNNDYCISDEAFDKYICIIPYEQFKKLIGDEYQPKEKNIEYCAYNFRMNIVFCYDKKGIHWFYE